MNETITKIEEKSNNMSIVSVPFIGTEDDKKSVTDNFNNFIKSV